MSTRDYAVDAQALAEGESLLATLAKSRAVKIGLSILGPVTFIAIWAFFSAYYVEAYILPSPSAVFDRMIGLLEEGLVLGAFATTLVKTMMGFLAAFVIGVPIGLAMGRYRYASEFFHDFIYLLANVPLVVYAVLSLIVFGISDVGPAFVVTMLVLPAVAINVAAGVASADDNLLAMSRSFKRSTGAVRRAVIMPAVFPFLLAAGRVSFADSWKLAALTETFGGSSGVGYELHKAFTTFNVLDALAWMMFFVIFVVIVERLVLAPSERRIFQWRNPGTARQ